MSETIEERLARWLAEGPWWVDRRLTLRRPMLGQWTVGLIEDGTTIALMDGDTLDQAYRRALEAAEAREAAQLRAEER